MSIYIGNLSYEATEEDVSTVFAEYGTVKRVQLPTDRETGRRRGFGFVEMATREEAQAAMTALNATELGGRTLIVNEARPREPRTDGGGFGVDPLMPLPAGLRSARQSCRRWPSPRLRPCRS